MKAPFPWFGGKRVVSDVVWSRLGADVANYVEPFFGSGAVLLNRPGWTDEQSWIETVNDRDGFIANFWRAVQHDPAQVVRWAEGPVNENDLHARHVWLRERRETLTRRLEGDPDYYDAKVAGWWVWGMSLWIGSGFCSGNGSWVVEDGELVKRDALGGTKRKSLHLGDAGQGIQRQSLHLGNAGRGGIYSYFETLSARLRRVRVASGDWSRIMGESVTVKHGLTGVFLDPPYIHDGRNVDVYNEDHPDIAAEVRTWAIDNGDNPLLRIAYCGYESEDAFPENWQCVKWTQTGGYGSLRKDGENKNGEREKIWFSPHCVKPVEHIQFSLFS